MENFDLIKYLAEGKLLKENISKDIENYLNDAFEAYLEGGDSFEEEPGEIHTLTLEPDDLGDPEQYEDSDLFFKAVEQLKNSGLVLKYNKDYTGDYGKVIAKSDGTNINISFIVPE